MKKILITIFITVLTLSTAFGKDAKGLAQLEGTLQVTTPFTEILPGKKVQKVMYYFKDKKDIYTGITSQELYLDNVTGNLIFNSTSDYSTISYTFNKSLYMLNFDHKFNHDKAAKFIKTAKYDEYKKTLNIQSNELESIYLMKNKEVKQKSYSFGRNTIYIDTAGLYLQLLLSNNVKNFIADMLFEGIDKGYPTEFVLTEADSLMPYIEGYKDIPEFFTEGLKKVKGAKLYTFKLRGLPGLIYKHKFYIAFTGEAPHDYIANWGGDPKSPHFNIVSESNIIEVGK